MKLSFFRSGELPHGVTTIRSRFWGRAGERTEVSPGPNSGFVMALNGLSSQEHGIAYIQRCFH